MRSRSRAILLTATLLLFVGALPVLAQNTCPANPTLDQANAAFDAGQYEEAIGIFSCIIKTDYTNADAYIGRSGAYVMNGDWVPAAEDYRSASLYLGSQALRDVLNTRFDQLNKTPRPDLASWILRAHWYWWTANDAGAIPYYDLILIKNPDNLFALTFRGSSRLILGQKDEALTDWKRAFEIAPDNWSVNMILGSTYYWIGDAENMLKYDDRARELAPQSAYTYRGCARAYFMSKDYQKAADEYAQSLKLDLPPTARVETLAELGQLYLQMGRQNDAADVFAQAETTLPSSPWTSYNLAYAYQNAGYTTESAQAFMAYVNRLDAKVIDEQPLLNGKAQTVDVGPNGRIIYSIPLNLSKGQDIQISAEAGNSAVDPIIILVNPSGSAVAANDNAQSGNTLNAVIPGYIPLYGGHYTLLVTTIFGSSGGSVDINLSEKTPLMRRSPY